MKNRKAKKANRAKKQSRNMLLRLNDVTKLSTSRLLTLDNELEELGYQEAAVGVGLTVYLEQCRNYLECRKDNTPVELFLSIPAYDRHFSTLSERDRDDFLYDCAFVCWQVVTKNPLLSTVINGTPIFEMNVGGQAVKGMNDMTIELTGGETAQFAVKKVGSSFIVCLPEESGLTAEECSDALNCDNDNDNDNLGVLRIAS